MDAHIKIAKEDFEKRFKESSYYNMQTQDEEHIDHILDKLAIKSGDRIMDFGAGLGYLSFAIAQKYPGCEVIGIDIVKEALEINRKEAKKRGLDNLSFIRYDGNILPFNKESFDIVVTRYVMHHVPNIKDIINQISCILRDKGKFFISDPTPFEMDTGRFVDSFMQMIKDGHIKFYTLDEYIKLAEDAGLEYKFNDFTKIRFPRQNAEDYMCLVNAQAKEVLDTYEIQVSGDEIFITENVLNMLFIKNMS